MTHPMIRRLRGIESARDFLHGINAAAVALMLVVTRQLGTVALVDISTVVVAVAGFGLLLTTRLNSTWLIAAAIAGGLMLNL